MGNKKTYYYLKPKTDYVELFLQSRQSLNVSHNMLKLYRFVLERFSAQVNLSKASSHDIEWYLMNIPAKGISLGNRHAHYRMLKTFYRWLENTHNTRSPMRFIDAPRLPKLILPSLTQEQVLRLIESVGNDRNKAIIALAVESGLRISELANVRTEDISWETRVIRTVGKGRKEAYASFGELTEK